MGLKVHELFAASTSWFVIEDAGYWAWNEVQVRLRFVFNLNAK